MKFDNKFQIFNLQIYFLILRPLKKKKAIGTVLCHGCTAATLGQTIFIFHFSVTKVVKANLLEKADLSSPVFRFERTQSPKFHSIELLCYPLIESDSILFDSILRLSSVT